MCSMIWTAQGLELADRSSATIHVHQGIKDKTTTLSGSEPPLGNPHAMNFMLPATLHDNTPRVYNAMPPPFSNGPLTFSRSW